MRIVHSSISENGDAGWDGKAVAGDQTSMEVCVRGWYNKGWNYMLEYPDVNINEKVVNIAVKLANSNLVGYDQSQRNTLYMELEKNDWNVDKYIESGVRTECDCSSFLYACYCCLIPRMRGMKNAPTTSNMRVYYPKWGFILYTQSKYITNSSYLKKANILVKEGSHTVMAIDNGSKSQTTTIIKAVDYAEKLDKSLAGRYKALDSVFIRNGAGKEHSAIGVLPKDFDTICYGYYSYGNDGNKWLYTESRVKNSVITGFISSRLLLKY